MCHLSARHHRASPGLAQPKGCLEEWGREESGAPGGASHGKGRLEHKIQESALNFQLECYSSVSTSEVTGLGASPGQSTCGPKVLLGPLGLIEGVLAVDRVRRENSAALLSVFPPLTSGTKKSRLALFFGSDKLPPLGALKPSALCCSTLTPSASPSPGLPWTAAAGFGWSCKYVSASRLCCVAVCIFSDFHGAGL